MKKTRRFKTTDEYIKTFPKEVAGKLEVIRKIIKKAAPEAEEVIAYNMPAFKLNGPLIYYSGYNKHIGLYAMPSATIAFKKELVKYKTSKSAIQLPLEEKLPLTLIKKIVQFRVKENLAKRKK